MEKSDTESTSSQNSDSTSDYDKPTSSSSNSSSTESSNRSEPIFSKSSSTSQSKKSTSSSSSYNSSENSSVSRSSHNLEAGNKSESSKKSRSSTSSDNSNHSGSSHNSEVSNVTDSSKKSRSSTSSDNSNHSESSDNIEVSKSKSSTNTDSSKPSESSHDLEVNNKSEDSRQSKSSTNTDSSKRSESSHDLEFNNKSEDSRQSKSSTNIDSSKRSESSHDLEVNNKSDSSKKSKSTSDKSESSSSTTSDISSDESPEIVHRNRLSSIESSLLQPDANEQTPKPPTETKLKKPSKQSSPRKHKKGATKAKGKPKIAARKAKAKNGKSIRSKRSVNKLQRASTSNDVTQEMTNEHPGPHLKQRAHTSNDLPFVDSADSKYLCEDQSSDAPAKIDRYGWVIETADTNEEKKRQKLESKKEKEREIKWIEMTRKWETYSLRKRKVLDRRINKGIPDCMRSLAWNLILQSEIRNDLLSVDEYFSIGEPPSNHVILVDIPRTMPKVLIFRQQNLKVSLYRVLRAYSNFDRELGYYQGMGFIAAMLMNYMDEETTFKCFVAIMNGNNHRQRELFINDFSGLHKVNKAWDLILAKKYPKIHEKIVGELHIDHTFYTMPWFLCAFMNVEFPPVVKLRIFDRYLAFGTRTLISLGLGIVELAKKKIMIGSFESVLSILQNPGDEIKDDWRVLMNAYDRNMIKKDEYLNAYKTANK